MAIGLSVLGVQAQNTSAILTFSLTALVEAPGSGAWTETKDRAGNVTAEKTIYKSVKVKITNQDILNLMTNGYGGKFPAGAMLVVTEDSEDSGESGGVAIQVSDKTGTNVLWTPESFRVGAGLMNEENRPVNVYETGSELKSTTWARDPTSLEYDRTATTEAGSSVEHELSTITFGSEDEDFSVLGDFISSDSWNEKRVRSKDGVWTETEVKKKTGKASVVGSGTFNKRVPSAEGESSGIVSGTLSVTQSYTRKRPVIPPVGAVSGMALIPAGAFTMGDTLDGDSDADPVTVNVSAFYMDTNLVSKAQWDEVYTWAITNGYSFDRVGSGKAANHPVHTISWYDVVKWCNARSEKEGWTAAYYTDVGLSTVYRSGQLSPSVKWNGGYRLPTEAEWEKAARGGLSGQRFPWGNTISRSQANYRGDTSNGYDLGPDGYNPAYTGGGYPYTGPVGSFAPNGYGLYDMAGNIWQRCWDNYGTPYAGGTDPRGAASGIERVIRGGNWADFADGSRSAKRRSELLDIGNDNIGFRVVLSLGQP